MASAGSSITLVPEAPSALERFVGHHRTLMGYFARARYHGEPPRTEKWQTVLVDPTIGEIILTGRYFRGTGKRLVLFVHGLGGSVESGYMRSGLRAAAMTGDSCLLLNLRGADRRGHDFYHAGLDSDLSTAIAAFPNYERIDIFGYSLGGHVALSYAAGNPDPRVGRVAAVGTPLDLAISADSFDAPRWSIYRRHVMASLYEIYTASFQRRPTGIIPPEARQITKIREWDERVVAPRHGFKDANHYYDSVSVAPKLVNLRIPGLYVGAPADPMVPVQAVPLGAANANLKVHWDRRAGHLGFPEDFDLGEQAPRGLEPQVLSWLSGN